MRQIPGPELRPYPASLLALAMILALAGCGDPAVAPEQPDASPALSVQATAALSFRQISAGMYHSCGVTYDDVAYCWGADGVGQLGDGAVNISQRTSPVPVAGGLQFKMVSAGFDHSCGVTTQNQVYCWGSNSRGQLGNGSIGGDQSTPVLVSGQPPLSLRFDFVSAGYVHTCAIHLSDAAWCWGNNDNGRLGDGTTIERPWPTPVQGGLLFRRIAAGGFHTCGVTMDSRAYCWGRNEQGQLGDGTLSSRHKPVEVAGGRSFRWVTTGSANISFKWQSATCGISGGGKAYCWGSNLHGQLGDGSHTQRLRPVAVKGGLSFSQVNSGGGHTCGVTPGNLTYCWGYNGKGQLGDGTSTERITPRAVTGGHLFRAVPTAGGYGGGHTCALTTGDAAFCWGYNVFGQVGDGSTTDRRAPTAVAGPS
ncbi:MAG: RCC1 domain-containing protein [Gemmatimonadales bacterium]